MKIFSLDGKGSGKVGGSVYYVNRGVQVRREYTAAVTNPSTAAQVGQRSRFKLASQVSASLADVIAIPRIGIVSPRNAFVKLNMPFFYAEPAGAFVSYDSLQITRGNIGLPDVVASRNGGNRVAVHLSQPVSPSISYVVYNVFNILADGVLTFTASEVVDTRNAQSVASVSIEGISGAVVIYAYGFSLTNAKAVAKYGRYEVSSGLDVARLVSSRTLDKQDIRFSVTSGLYLAANESEGGSVQPGKYKLQLLSNGLGDISCEIDGEAVEVTSGGVIEVDEGADVLLSAFSPNSHPFLGWFNNGEQNPFSSESITSFYMTGPRYIIARWAQAGGLE